MLKDVIAKMPEDQAKYHMKRCVDSGLWVADANANEHGLVEEREEEKPPVYATVQKLDDLDLD